MTAHWLVAATCLVAAAVVLGWPQRSRPARLLTSSRPAPSSLQARVESLSSRRAMVLAVALAALIGTLLAGPVAGVVAGGYGAIAVRTVLRRRASRAAAAMRTRSLDALCGLAADLRAGLPAAGADPVGSTPAARPRAGAPSPGGTTDSVTGPAAIEDHRMAHLAGAAWRLAERTGAPIADLVERIEADARAMDRASAAAAAQAAGARATAWLLAGLPVGGIALGYTIGADPLAVLLHTPIGAACAVGAIVLQVAGLAWADRIASAGTARPEPAPATPAPTSAVSPAPAPAAAQPPTPAPGPALASAAGSTRTPAPARATAPRSSQAPALASAAGSTRMPAPVWATAPRSSQAPPAGQPPASTAPLTPTASPLRTVGAKVARLRDAAPAHADSAEATGSAGRPKPRPRPRAAAVTDRPDPGSEA
jgi:tight adherence protein B